MGEETERREVRIQREYYSSTATHDDLTDIHAHDEHFMAFAFLEAAIEAYGVRSVLDVGAGAGRMVLLLKQRFPDLIVKGIEPVDALRETGYRNGLSRDDLSEGDATELAFDDGQFDIVCEFGILHHIRKPRLAVEEMIRVGRMGIFISDTNNFGRGSALARTVKQALDMFGLWKLADYVKTRGKGYTLSEGDGLAYSYSVFNDFPLIRKHCEVHVLNTSAGGVNPYRTASHIALLGLKK